MFRWALCVLGSCAALAVAQQQPEPEGLRDRIVDRMNGELARITDYVCLQTVQRFSRFGDSNPWRANDALRLEVGLSGDRELYSWPGARQFDDKELADMIGRGSVGTGLFGLLARHVFQPGLATFTWRGEEMHAGRSAYHYDYVVRRERSSYRVRTGGGEAVVGFEGSFWVDASSLDLLRLEVHAVNIPEQLALAQASNLMEYSRVAVGEREFLLPANSELIMIATTGEETRNVLDLSRCREFRGESKISFGAEPDAAPIETAAAARPSEFVLPAGVQIELELQDDLDFKDAVIGSRLRAAVSKDVKDGGQVVVPEGTPVTGRLVRIERQSVPFAMYEVALAFNALTLDGREVPFTATMDEAGNAAGLIREERKFSPTFDRRRSPRLNILVNENASGQGVLHWDAKKDKIPRGFKMKWTVE